MYEQPTEYQEQLIAKLLSRDFPGAEALREQAANCKVENCIDEDSDGGFVIHVDKTAPHADVAAAIPVEGIVDTVPPVEFLLHTNSGYLAELEVVTYGDSPVDFPIPLESIEVLTNDERARYEKDQGSLNSRWVPRVISWFHKNR